MKRRAFSQGLAAPALAGLLPAAARAQAAYPDHPVRMIVPFVPGGTTDVVARIVSTPLGTELGQPVVIDNKGGAGGVLGADLAAKAPADGYTLLLFHVGMVYGTGLYKSLPYDVEKDFAPISLVGVAPSVLVVAPSLPVKSLAEFTARAKASPGAMNYGTAGAGTSGHLAVELYQTVAGVKVTHVPYKGGGPAITAVMGGEIEFMIETLGTVVPLIKSGKLKALAVTGDKRSPALPDVPTMREAGLADYVYTTWYGLWAPGRTPQPVVGRLNGAVQKLLAQEDVRNRLDQAGVEPSYTTPQQFAGIVRDDLKLWGGIIRKAGIQAQ